MKKFLKIFSLIFIASMLIWSCEDEDRDPVLHEGNATAAVITFPSTSLVVECLEENASQEAISFEWTPASYGLSIAINYRVELDLASGDFSSPINVGVTNYNTFTLTQQALSSAVLSLGADPLIQTSVKVRIYSYVNGISTTTVSEPYTFDVIAFDPYKRIYLPGSYQGWDPAEPAPSIIAPLDGNGDPQSSIYEGYVYFGESNTSFKFTDVPSWDGQQYGAATSSGNSGTLASPGNNISVTGDAGTYKINANLDASTYTVLKINWGIVGSATPGGWDTDTDLIYDTETKTFKAVVALNAGEFKFRANDVWDTNFGDDNGDGVLNYNSANNISLSTGGTYLVELNLNNSQRYTYKLTLQ